MLTFMAISLNTKKPSTKSFIWSFATNGSETWTPCKGRKFETSESDVVLVLSPKNTDRINDEILKMIQACVH